MFGFSKFTYRGIQPSKHCIEESLSEDYQVKVNGTEIPVYTCRITKYPFNRSWPGFQRPREQSVDASYVNLVSDEEVTLEVTVNRPFERVLIKPYSKNIRPQIQSNVITFKVKPDDKLILALGDYHYCLYVFNSKPVVCKNPETVTYYFGPGIHLAGKICLKDNESVYVDKDALIYGCVYAENAKNIRVYGNGVFDDSMEERVFLHCYENYTNGNARFYDCQNVRVEGVLFKNSSNFCVSTWHCFDVLFDNIKVFGQWRYNTDGVDIINSQNVLLRNSFVHSFDDTVSIKGIERYRDTDCKNIRIESCVLTCDWGRACEIGLETNCKTYENITFTDCDVLHGGYAAFDVQNGDYAEVRNIRFENSRVEYERFHRPEVQQRTEEQKYDRQNETIRSCLLNIVNHRSPCNAVLVDAEAMGVPAAQVHDIVVKDITVYYDEAIPLENGKFQTPIHIESTVYGVKHYNITVENVSVNGVKLTEENTPLELSDVENFTLK